MVLFLLPPSDNHSNSFQFAGRQPLPWDYFRVGPSSDPMAASLPLTEGECCNRAAHAGLLRDQRARIGARACRLRWHTIFMRSKNNSRRRQYFFSLLVCGVFLSGDLSQGQQADRPTDSLPDAPKPNLAEEKRGSLPAGWNLTARTGRGGLLPRRPQRGGGFRRRWIRLHSPMLIGRMEVRRRLGSRTQTAIL